MSVCRFCDLGHRGHREGCPGASPSAVVFGPPPPPTLAEAVNLLERAVPVEDQHLWFAEVDEFLKRAKGRHG